MSDLNLTRPICAFGEHIIADDEYYYTINPAFGYGFKVECLCCETCIRKPENAVARQRMIDAGAKELETQ